jgi:hypothetical protein
VVDEFGRGKWINVSNKLFDLLEKTNPNSSVE